MVPLMCSAKQHDQGGSVAVQMYELQGSELEVPESIE